MSKPIKGYLQISAKKISSGFVSLGFGYTSQKIFRKIRKKFAGNWRVQKLRYEAMKTFTSGFSFSCFVALSHRVPEVDGSFSQPEGNKTF